MALSGTNNLRQRQTNRTLTAATVEPVTLAEVKEHLRITFDAQDAYIEDAIVAAREEIEAVSGFSFTTATFLTVLDRLPGATDEWWDGARYGSIAYLHGAQNILAQIELPAYPLIEVLTATFTDYANVETSAVPADLFNIDTVSYPGRVALKQGAVWPIAGRNINSVKLTYTAGFGATAADVPEWAKRAIRTMAAYLYDNRGVGCSTADAYHASGADRIVRKFRATRF